MAAKPKSLRHPPHPRRRPRPHPRRLRRRGLARAAAAARRRAPREGRRLRRPGVAAHRPDRRRPARRGPAAQGRQQLRRRLQQHRRRRPPPSAASRRQHARRADRRHRRHGLLPAHRRGPPRSSRATTTRRAGQWKTWEPLGHLGQDLAGRTLGIVGMGRIGYALAKRCRGGWDMKVLYHDVYRNAQAEKDLGAQQVDLDTLLARVRLRLGPHRPQRHDARPVQRRRRSRKMKRTAVFVNTARGPLVDREGPDRGAEDRRRSSRPAWT